MRAIISSIVALTIFYSCIQTTNSSIKNHKSIYLKEYVDCYWPNEQVIDTTFAGNITFKVVTRCQNQHTYVDTVEYSKDTFLIRNWRDMELVISSNKFDNILFTKEDVGDSLAADLKWNGFLSPPYNISFQESDSSIILKTFIGHAESDVGDVYIIKIKYNGKTEVLGIEALEMGLD